MKLVGVKVKKKDENFSKVGSQVLSKLDEVIRILKEKESSVANYTGEDRKRAEAVVLSIENRMNEVYNALRNWKKQVK